MRRPRSVNGFENRESFNAITPCMIRGLAILMNGDEVLAFNW